MVTLRKTLCAMVCALSLSVAAPAAASHCSPPIAHYTLAAADQPMLTLASESFTWEAFWKFWKRQLDRTAGVVGVVLLVAAAATVIIISRSRR
jgi:hypothetical protein